jgi:hypothetical protein
VPKKSARTFRTNFRRPNQTIRRNELILSESSGEPAAFKRIGVAASVLSTPAELSCVKKLGHETSPRKRQYSLMARQPWRPRSPISALPRKNGAHSNRRSAPCLISQDIDLEQRAHRGLVVCFLEQRRIAAVKIRSIPPTALNSRMFFFSAPGCRDEPVDQSRPYDHAIWWFADSDFRV